MTRIARIAVVVIGLGALAFAPAAVAGAAAAKQPAPLGVVPNALPHGYIVVSSPGLTAPAGSQTHGTADCPANTVVYGGGVFVNSLSLPANVNSSYPSTTQWNADVNNASSSSTTFTVDAICAKRTADWSIVHSGSVTNPAMRRRGPASPARVDQVLGGGGFSSTLSTKVNENSSFPLKSGSGALTTFFWTVDQNNANTTAATVTAYAVCGHASGYKLVTGAFTSSPAQTQALAAVSCPGSKAPLGGGIATNSSSLKVNINTTFPAPHGWQNYENNATTGEFTLTPDVICAGP